MGHTLWGTFKADRHTFAGLGYTFPEDAKPAAEAVVTRLRRGHLQSNGPPSALPLHPRKAEARHDLLGLLGQELVVSFRSIRVPRDWRVVLPARIVTIFGAGSI